MEFGYWSLIPPVLAIGLALITKKVYISLFAGIAVGALIFTHGDIISAIGKIVTIFWDNLELKNFSSWENFNNSWNLFILFFLIFLGILVALVNRAGGALAYGNWVIKKIKTREGASFATFILGVLIFLDDYFNCLTVGTVMKPLTDKHRISRAKLAYIIDSTAAPVCIIAPVSSWVANVISQLTQSGVGKDTLAAFNPYNVFLTSVVFNSYALLTMFMVVLMAFKSYDFGVMREHEIRAKKFGDLYNGGKEVSKIVDKEITPSKNGKVIDLLIPILFLIVMLIGFMLYTGGYKLLGGENSMFDAFQNMNSAKALFYSGLISVIFAVVYFAARKLIPLSEYPKLFWAGFRLMLPANCILILAWGIGSIIKNDLQTGQFIGTLAAQNFPIELMPAILFLIACLVAYSTGTSWGTFAILIPMAIPMVVSTGRTDLLMAMISAVLGGAVYGDHVSPISDTTIMSSTGAGCNHLDHVNTQMPYATLVAGVCFVGYIIMGFTARYGLGVSGTVNLLFCVPVLYILVRVLSKKASQKDDSIEDKQKA